MYLFSNKNQKHCHEYISRTEERTINISITLKLYNKTCPLKLHCGSKESTSKLISDFKASVKNGAQLPADFFLANDKTLL